MKAIFGQNEFEEKENNDEENKEEEQEEEQEVEIYAQTPKRSNQEFWNNSSTFNKKWQPTTKKRKVKLHSKYK